MRITYRLLLLFISIPLLFLLSSCSPHSSDSDYREVDAHFPVQAKRIALLPLDSRPACTLLPERLARIGNVDLVTPPKDILDHYHRPADRMQLRNWLQAEADKTDVMIVSADMLLHGSLLHSRKNELTDEDVTSALDFLRTLRKEHPSLRLFVFHTIPRLLIADDEETEEYQEDMLSYSTLQEEIHIFNQSDLLEDMMELEEDIPQEIRDRYHRLYERNRKTNEALLSLVADGTIEYLAIGQDDGHIFGLPNLVKDHLDRQVQRDTLLSERVEIVRGADELAMLLVSRIITEELPPLSVYVAYGDEDMSGVVMPFMSQSVNTTVEEKLSSVNAQRVYSADDADYILYLYIGNDASDLKRPHIAADAIRRFDGTGKPVALVDLSEHFRASETLFPTLLTEEFPIHRLIAYAGWNTASNAIGTAVSEATVYTAKMKQAQTAEEQLAIGHANLLYLNDRFLDDYYYMKLIQPYLKLRLSALLSDPYQLSMKAYYEANGWLDTAMQNQADLLSATTSHKAPFSLPLAALDESFAISRLTVESSLPWERTFEANVISKISLKKSKKSVDTAR
ncbi:MAG: DUF4127 family protein [Selenomonadales bacterium]|nr:DUF4127 family protein [Selenomonadales bacterium]